MTCSKCQQTLVERDLTGATPEQKSCGRLFYCPACQSRTGALVMSDELETQLEQMRRAGAQLDLQWAEAK